MDENKLREGRWTLLHAGRNATKADVHRVEAGGRRYAVKDYRPRPALIRATVGRWSLGREERAYRALRDLPGVPALAGRPSPHLLVTELVEGTSLAAWDRGRPLPGGFFGRLKDLLEQVHRRGVVQGDLHHRDVLVGGDGKAWLVDFSTSLSGGPGRLPLRSHLWRLLARLDRRAVLKLQERYEPGTLTPEEAGELAAAPGIYRVGKWLRRLVRR
jgi:hypothetical protein